MVLKEKFDTDYADSATCVCSSVSLRMVYIWSSCMLFLGFLCFAFTGLVCGIESEGTSSTSTVCANGLHTISCGSNTVIAITEMAYGYKGAPSGCSTAAGSCCTYDNTTDCLESSTTDTTLMDALSGKADGIANIADAIANTNCTSGYMSVSTFNRMTYQCIPESRILEMCVNGSYRSGDGLPVYIQNRDYQSGTSILPTDTSCSVSIELLSHSTNVQLYTLHMQLSDPLTSCQQSITVSNGNTVVKSFDCIPAPYNQIQSETIAGNYFIFTFTNTNPTPGGKFWIGVEGASGSPAIVISSPAVDRINCGNPPHPANGNVSYSATTFASQATFTCNVGFELFGTATQTCLENGWSGLAPTCSQVTSATSPPETDDGDKTLVQIIVPVVVAVLLIGVLIAFLCYRHKRKQHALCKEH